MPPPLGSLEEELVLLNSAKLALTPSSCLLRGFPSYLLTLDLFTITSVGAEIMTLTYKFSKGAGGERWPSTHSLGCDRCARHVISRVRAGTRSKGPQEAEEQAAAGNNRRSSGRMGEHSTLYKWQCSYMVGHGAGIQDAGLGCMHAQGGGAVTGESSMPESGELRLCGGQRVHGLAYSQPWRLLSADRVLREGEETDSHSCP